MMLLRNTLRCCNRSLYGIIMARFCRGTQSHGAQLPPDIVEYLYTKTDVFLTSLSFTMYGKYAEVFMHFAMLNSHAGKALSGFSA